MKPRYVLCIFLAIQASTSFEKKLISIGKRGLETGRNSHDMVETVGDLFTRHHVITTPNYTLQQVELLSARFQHSKVQDYSLTDWIKWSEADGMLCRNDLDCNWIFPSFYCHIDPNIPHAEPWFGTSVNGFCACQDPTVFDQDKLECTEEKYGPWEIAAIIIGCFSFLAVVAIGLYKKYKKKEQSHENDERSNDEELHLFRHKASEHPSVQDR